jgi:hypothetical protein
VSAAAAPSGGAQRRASPPRTGSGWGLALTGSLHAPGLLDGRSPLGGRRRTHLELVPPEAMRRAWASDSVTRITEWRSDGRTEMTLDRVDDGYRIYADGYGRFLVSADGSRVRCAPVESAAWRWQRFLIGRVLPLAAVLQGLEVIHASAVSLGGLAVAFTGSSGAGKTSLAVHMTLRGASFLSDDVVALETAGDRVLAHPGPAVASLRRAEAASISPGDLGRLGPVLGEGPEEVRVAIARGGAAAPLAAICFLAGGTAAEPLVEPIPSLDPRQLIASTFDFVVDSPDRLENQLDVMAHLARSARPIKARLAPGTSAAALAEAVHLHLVEAPGA